MFEKIVSEYLHLTSQKRVLNLFFIIDIFLFLSNRKFHFCDGKLIREINQSLCRKVLSSHQSHQSFFEKKNLFF